MKKLFISIMLFTCIQLQAQKNGDYNVAIFLYDGVELLDFSGPGEVFAVSEGFNVYTVSVDGNKILSQGFVAVIPQYAIDNAPEPDIIVYPGGSTSKSAKDPRVINWVKESGKREAVQMSVCTGAMILAEAGLLDGLNVTTWYGAIDRLKKKIPNSTVLQDTRFVDSGNIITTAGVSAGIDGALHMVKRIKGIDEAESTAKYMEYDKWDPNDGLIDYENELITEIKTQGPKQKLISTIGTNSDNSLPFYEGEMKNLAFEYMEKEEWSKAESILELVIKFYPNSISSYESLGKAYDKQGKFAPMSEEEFINLLLDGNFDEAMEAYQKAQTEYPGWMMFRESYMNYAGYQYLEKEKYNEAIKLFTLNTQVYPNSANVFDSLGEAYLKNGDFKSALTNYKKALELDPHKESALAAVERLKKDLPQTGDY